MARRLTKNAISKLLGKGLTGWEAGKLVIQNCIEASCGRKELLTEMDIASVRQGLRNRKDGLDYNSLLETHRLTNRGLIIAETASQDGCLFLNSLIMMLRDVRAKNTVDLVMSIRPQIVTEKQYQNIVVAQKQKKLAFEYSLAYVIEERFFSIAPAEVRKDIDEMGLDSDSAESFRVAVQDKYADLYKQAITEIHKLHTSGKLNAVCYEEDAKVAEPLLDQWRKKGLSGAEAAKLVDMLFVTGQQLYDCDELPEWKEFVDKYQRHWLADEDERFRHTYAILQDPPSGWVDKKGDYQDRFHPSEWVTRGSEATLGLRTADGKKTKSEKRVGRDLLTILERAKLDIRIFLALKAVIDTASEVIGVGFSEDGRGLENMFEQLALNAEEYNWCLEHLDKGLRHSKSHESKLEKALKVLSAIEIDDLKPSVASMQELKDELLTDLGDEKWLREKLRCLEYEDGFSFTELLGDG